MIGVACCTAAAAGSALVWRYLRASHSVTPMITSTTNTQPVAKLAGVYTSSIWSQPSVSGHGNGSEKLPSFGGMPERHSAVL